MDSSDEEMFLFQILFDEEEENRKRKRRAPKYWVHEINMKRTNYGEFHHLYPDLKRDPVKFFQYYRLSYEKFQVLLDLLGLCKETTRFRRPIPPEERLAVCLRFLATGDPSFRSLAFSFRMGEKTVRTIVYETCTAIWNKMQPTPPTEQEWKEIAKAFWQKWNFPNCIGGLDGKHVVIECPHNSGSKYYCYKKTFCIVLLALVDAEYKFTLLDIGGLGKNSDGCIFSNSVMGKSLTQNKLNVPRDTCLPGTEDYIMPYVIVADAAFPLRSFLMRPYPGNQTINNEEKKIFNYRLSRARRVSENAFGILARRFRIYERRLSLTPEHVNIVVAATIALHNFLRNSATYWSEEDLRENVNHGLVDLPQLGSNASQAAFEIREKFKTYFLSNTGSVPWQTNIVRRGFQHHSL